MLLFKVKSLILSKSEFSVHRYFYAGSSGKHTDILVPDFDVILFLNNELPPFNNVLDEWTTILKREEGQLIAKGSIKTTKFSVQFEVNTPQGRLEVDVLPAANLVSGHIERPRRGRRLYGLQKCGVQGHINHENQKSLSSSLSESQVQFMKDQSEFTHQVSTQNQ